MIPTASRAGLSKCKSWSVGRVLREVILTEVDFAVNTNNVIVNVIIQGVGTGGVEVRAVIGSAQRLLAVRRFLRGRNVRLIGQAEVFIVLVHLGLVGEQDIRWLAGTANNNNVAV